MASRDNHYEAAFEQYLRSHGVPEDAASETAAVVTECDGLRFGFVETADVPALCDRALKTVRALERALRRHVPPAPGGDA